MSDSSPEEKIQLIYAVFQGLPVAYQSQLLDKLHDFFENDDGDSDDDDIPFAKAK